MKLTEKVLHKVNNRKKRKKNRTNIKPLKKNWIDFEIGLLSNFVLENFSFFNRTLLKFCY